MTIICKHCGCENHLDSETCIECGQPLKKDETYVVCSTCGISNPKSAKTCIGCGEKLGGNHSFEVDSGGPAEEEVLSEEATGVVKKPKEKKEKKPIKNKGVFVIIGLATLLIVLLVGLIIGFVASQNMYLNGDEGHYYVSDTGVLHVIDREGKNYEVGYDVKTLTAIEKYGDHIYYISDQALHLYDGKSNQLIATSVADFEVNHKGDEVLYLVTSETLLEGDLYKFDGTESLRIDGSVGLERYIFGQKDDIYYVKDVTEDENLGELYAKYGNKPSEYIVEDIYAPLFSLRKGSVYYSRADLSSVDRFDLFYVSDHKVTEVKRNVSQVHYHPTDENFAIIQYRNNEENLYAVKRDTTELIEKGFVKSGIFSFDDHDMIQRVEKVQLVLQNNQSQNYFYDGDLKEMGLFDEFWLSKDTKKIYTTNDSELLLSDYNGTLTNTLSLAGSGMIEDLSASGRTAVVLIDNQYNLYNNSKLEALKENIEHVSISSDERYIVYLEGQDAYALKIGAEEPVFLGSQVKELYSEGDYVYTIINNELYRYKLGKFSSNTLISRFRNWGQLD